MSVPSDQTSVALKRCLSPSPHDRDLSILGYTLSESPPLHGYDLIYIDPSELLPGDVVDPLHLTLSFHWAGCFYSLVKLSSSRKFAFDPSETDHG